MRLVFAGLIAALTACGQGGEPAPEHPVQPEPGADVVGSAKAAETSSCIESSNIIDVAACPGMIARGCAVTPRASTEELCRRLHIDLIGTVPTSSEVVLNCEGKQPAQIAKALMATPAFVRRSLEMWAETLAYEPAQVDAKWLKGADEIVGLMVTGAITYDEFAKRIVGQPIFGIGARLPRADIDEGDHPFFFNQVAERVMRVFLGRAPIGHEATSFASLFGFWRKNIVLTSSTSGYAEAVIDPSACPCESSVLGTTTRIELPLREATAYENVPAAVRPALDAQLRKPGALLAAQRPFWTQGVDLALAMYLGWWRSTTNLDSTTLVEVQVALAEQFRAMPSWPDLVLSIVTSALYVRPNRLSEGLTDDVPVWCTGPTRNLRPEAFVSSLGHLLSVGVGRCDHRTYEQRGSTAVFFRPELREDEDSDAALFGSHDFHLVAARRMGGCIAGGPRTEEAALAPVFGAPSVAAEICAASTAIQSSGVRREDVSPEAASRIIDHVSQLLRRRPASAAEKRAFASEGSACKADATCDAAKLATTACVAIARSLDMITY